MQFQLKRKKLYFKKKKAFSSLFGRKSSRLKALKEEALPVFFEKSIKSLLKQFEKNSLSQSDIDKLYRIKFDQNSSLKKLI